MDEDFRSGDNTELPPAALSALMNGRKIQAIKIVREENRVGLKEAKHAVDNYIQTHPELMQQMKRVQSTSNRGAWLVIIVGVLVLLWLSFK